MSCSVTMLACLRFFRSDTAAQETEFEVWFEEKASNLKHHEQLFSLEMFCGDATRSWVGATNSYHNWGLMWIYSAELLCPCIFCQKVKKYWRLMKSQVLTIGCTKKWMSWQLAKSGDSSIHRNHLDHLCWIVFVILGSSFHTEVRPNIHYSEQPVFNEMFIHD